MTRHRVVVAAFLVSIALTGRSARSANPEATLYKGEPVVSSGVTLGGWGSGVAVESQREYFTGTNSIGIHTDGYYAGGRIEFIPGLDISDAMNTRDTYLVLMVRFPSLEAEGGDSLGASSGPAIPPRLPGQAPVAGPGADQPGPRIGFFRVQAVVNGVTLVSDDQPIDLKRTESGWTTVSLPLASFKGPRVPGRAVLSRLIISGDRPDDFFLGEIRTAIDDAEIVLDEVPEEQTVNPGDPVTFNVTANPGMANVEIVWDFDKRDGIQEDAFGSSVVHTYRDPGVYTVTLKVRDINHVKPDLVQEITVNVTQ